MKFLKDLRVISENAVLRICSHLRINNEYAMSVQASELHYCRPRALLPIQEYTHFEMAIVYNGQLTSNTNVISEFPRLDELLYCFDGGVFHEVPKDLIEDLYTWWLLQQ